jgi:hypothetical protein
MRVITRDQVKAQLGILDNSLDTQIDAKLPIIDAKVKQISGNNFNMQISATLISGSKIATITSVNNSINQYTLEDIQEFVNVADQIEGDGITAESYIEELYYNGSYVTLSGTQYTVPAIKINQVATLDGLQELFIGINIGYHDIIAKGVQYLITGTSTALPQNRLKSKSLPPLSVTYADSTVNKTYGMPNWFVEALPTYMSGH